MADPNDRLYQLLAEIQSKLNAPALNGGFETLMYKVDKIEEAQEKILTEVSNLNDTIYDPDKGLFARIKSVETAETEELLALEKSVAEVQTWKESEKKKVVDLEQQLIEKKEKITQMERQLEELARWKSSIMSTTKWIGITVGGAAISILVKLINDYLTGHVHFS